MGANEHISVITIMVCFGLFNDLAFVVHTNINSSSTKILGSSLVFFSFTTEHFCMCVLCKESCYFPERLRGESDSV